ncbi:Outer membrane protein assembly factor BamB, partial [termite gut metagenome]
MKKWTSVVLSVLFLSLSILPVLG